MRLIIFTILTICLLTKAPGQILEKFEFSDCIKECIGDSTKIDRVVQTNDLTEINLTAYANCIGNLEGRIKVTNDTLDLRYSVKATKTANKETGEMEEFSEIVFCDCIFKINYAVRGLKSLDIKKVKINGKTVDKINGKQFVKIDSAEYIFPIVERAAQFPGGPTKFRDYVNKNLRYPKGHKSGGQGDKVFLSFVINRDGAIDDNSVIVIKGLNDSFDNEAIRIMRKCPSWTPATIKGKPVKQKVVLSIPFDTHKGN